ncbi:helix-turn-helix transcriptional regulator [Bacillus hominis]|uniref:Helix-turn-helix transcriptional regulator n=1 Tax=Bacillus hominis TaxID=2817478 RepID=A0ABT7R6X0_9BACI|nr:helix-turn-helix transcriptional regulator [Bacillus hominis]MDM5193514.1 helix-turn-helix transcriptional regulator [Bacillus hominis]MDM5433236.1 helix-turn-helix transcriptional regulator [Bacillus hominis]MDM5438658.1 helix-turn-helix transcriptional regulator [Bacillus hominis]
MFKILVIENVEKIRKARRVTKTFIANKTGLSLQGYRHIVNKDVRLDVERLKKISGALNVPISIFFDDELTESVIEEMESEFVK